MATTTITTNATIEIRSRSLNDIPGRKSLRRGARLGFRCRAVFLEFVEQSLETDAKNLGGTCLVVLGVLKRDLNERLFRLAHSGSNRQTYHIGLVNRLRGTA